MARIMTRFYYGVPVRTTLNSNNMKWLFCAEDVCAALIKSKNAKSYWAMLKRKYIELNDLIDSIKLSEIDGKQRTVDMVYLNGLRKIAAYTSVMERNDFVKWAASTGKTVEDICKQRAYCFFNYCSCDMGSLNGLKQIHGRIFEGDESAGQLRVIKINGMAKIPSTYVSDNISLLIDMNIESFADMVFIYAMILAERPFEMGSGFCLRIWIDLLLRYRYRVCIDWSKIDKRQYRYAMNHSTSDLSLLRNLFFKAICGDITSRSLYMRGIDYSYYLDQEE